MFTKTLLLSTETQTNILDRFTENTIKGTFECPSLWPSSCWQKVLQGSEGCPQTCQVMQLRNTADVMMIVLWLDVNIPLWEVHIYSESKITWKNTFLHILIVSVSCLYLSKPKATMHWINIEFLFFFSFLWLFISSIVNTMWGIRDDCLAIKYQKSTNCCL